MEEDIIQQAFIRSALEDDVKRIFKAQLDIANARIYSRGSQGTKIQGTGRAVQGRSGALMESLQSPQFTIENSGKGVVLTSNLPLYIRFLDMKNKGNYAIYNRQVWGILYNNALQKVKFGYGKEVRDRIKEQLELAFNHLIE